MKIWRRKLVAGGLIAAAVPTAALALPAGPSATGATDPCAASEVARTIGSVAKSMGDYLDSHPETNQAMTTALQQQAGPQSVTSLKSYFEAHPKVASGHDVHSATADRAVDTMQAADHHPAGDGPDAAGAGAGGAAGAGAPALPPWRVAHFRVPRGAIPSARPSARFPLPGREAAMGPAGRCRKGRSRSAEPSIRVAAR